MSKIIKYDFDGHLYSFRLDGWFNATEAAKLRKKRLDHWLQTKETLEYIQALDEVMTGKPSEILNTRNHGYLETRRGKYAGGTWLHPKLAVRLAQWLDPKFAVWCDLQIDAIIRNGIRAEGDVDLLPLLLRPDVAAWELRFPPSYYQALARATHTKYTGHSGGTPALYGQLTEKWIYGCLLPSDVHAELKERRHKSEKMHQWLTEGGQELLDKQIALVTSIAGSSADLKDFEARMMLVSKKGGQLSMIYPKVA